MYLVPGAGGGLKTAVSRTGPELEMLCSNLRACMEAQMFEPVGIGFGKPVLAGRFSSLMCGGSLVIMNVTFFGGRH